MKPSTEDLLKFASSLTCKDAAELFLEARDRSPYEHARKCHEARAEMLRFFASAPVPSSLVEEWPGIFEPALRECERADK